MTPKPIVVTYLPEDVWSMWNNGKVVDFNEIKPDYHWFFIPDFDAKRIEIKVFYEKDFTPIQYEELKKMILDSLPQKSEQ